MLYLFICLYISITISSIYSNTYNPTLITLRVTSSLYSYQKDIFLPQITFSFLYSIISSLILPTKQIKIRPKNGNKTDERKKTFANLHAFADHLYVTGQVRDANPLLNEMGHNGYQPGHEIEPDHGILELFKGKVDELVDFLDFWVVHVMPSTWGGRERRLGVY